MLVGVPDRHRDGRLGRGHAAAVAVRPVYVTGPYKGAPFGAVGGGAGEGGAVQPGQRGRPLRDLGGPCYRALTVTSARSRRASMACRSG